MHDILRLVRYNLLSDRRLLLSDRLVRTQLFLKIGVLSTLLRL